MELFYKEELIFNDVTLSCLVVNIVILLLDYFLIYFKLENYLKFSISLLDIPEKFRSSSIEQVKTNKHLINFGDNPICSYPKKISSYMCSAMILTWPDGDDRIRGRIVFTPLKLLLFLIQPLLFYLSVGSPSWEDKSFFVFLLLGIVIIVIIGGVVAQTLFTLDLLRNKEVLPDEEPTFEEEEIFKSEIRETRLDLIISYLLFFPFGIIVVSPLIKKFPGTGFYIMLGYFFCFFGWATYHSYKLNFTNCIKCGYPFFKKGIRRKVLSTKCLHCGFSIEKG